MGGVPLCATASVLPFVDERSHRDAAVAADVEESAGLFLQGLGRVDEHHRAVHRGQDAVGVLGKVRVTGGVQEVEHAPAVRELQHGRGDRDAAGLLHLHPVRGHPAPPGLAVHRTRPGEGVGVQRERLGQRGLARVGMTDHRKGAPPRRLMGRHPVTVRGHTHRLQTRHRVMSQARRPCGERTTARRRRRRRAQVFVPCIGLDPVRTPCHQFLVPARQPPATASGSCSRTSG